MSITQLEGRLREDILELNKEMMREYVNKYRNVFKQIKGILHDVSRFLIMFEGENSTDLIDELRTFINLTKKNPQKQSVFKVKRRTTTSLDEFFDFFLNSCEEFFEKIKTRNDEGKNEKQTGEASIFEIRREKYILELIINGFLLQISNI